MANYQGSFLCVLLCTFCLIALFDVSDGQSRGGSLIYPGPGPGFPGQNGGGIPPPWINGGGNGRYCQCRRYYCRRGEYYDGMCYQPWYPRWRWRRHRLIRCCSYYGPYF